MIIMVKKTYIVLALLIGVVVLALFIIYFLLYPVVTSSGDRSTLCDPNKIYRIEITYAEMIKNPNNTLTIIVTIKNIGDGVITLTGADLPDAEWSTELNIKLVPGKTYTGTWLIELNTSKSEYWNTGTRHTFRVFYKAPCSTSINVKSIAVTVS